MAIDISRRKFLGAIGMSTLGLAMAGCEAQVFIDLGAGREITQEEAIDILHRSVEEGLMLERTFSKNAEIICCCDRVACTALGTLAGYKMFEKEILDGESTTFKQISHYTLEVDYDSCIGCGSCVARCPMEAVILKDGKPTVTGVCLRCGQCAVKCPQEARKLAPLPLENFFDFSQSIFEESNMQAAYRFEHGLIY